MKLKNKSVFYNALITIASAFLIWNLLAEVVVLYEMKVTGATSRADLADDMGLGILLLLVVPAGTLLLTTLMSLLTWMIIKKTTLSLTTESADRPAPFSEKTVLNIHSYARVNDLSFGADKAMALRKLGYPLRERTSRTGQLEMHYADFIIRLDSNDRRFREITLLPGCEALINSQKISWNDDFLQWIAKEDTDLKELHGFLVSLKLGIALTGFHDDDHEQQAIHAFRIHDWDSLAGRMQPFNITD